MKLINLNYLLILIYLISSNYAYSIERPENKNLIVHKDKKKIENIDFINSKREKISINNYSGNSIILNFWATWCAPCRKEMPMLERLKSSEKFKNTEILAINIADESYEKSKKFFNELNIKNLEIFFGTGSEIAKKLSIRGLPTTILIDKEGYEFARIIGYIDFEDKHFLNWLGKNL